MSLLLIDADSVYWPVCYHSKKKNEIRKGIDKSIKQIIADAQGRLFDMDVQTVIGVKGLPNFRKEIYPEYKSHRGDMEEDMRDALNYAHNYLLEKWDAVPSNGGEADDLVGIWAAEARAAGIDHIIAHIDKDLDMIPGIHYNYGKPTEKKPQWYEVSEDEADLNFMKQCLTGDRTDAIPGLFRVGPVKAAKLLERVSYKDRWDVVRKEWESRGHTYEELCISARLLWMSTSWEEFEQANLPLINKLEVRNAGDESPGLGSSTCSDECEGVVSEQDDLPQQVDGDCGVQEVQEGMDGASKGP